MRKYFSRLQSLLINYVPRWFVIIQKTRPLIGLPNPEEELRILEEKANATYGVYKEKLDTKEKLVVAVFGYEINLSGTNWTIKGMCY